MIFYLVNKDFIHSFKTHAWSIVIIGLLVLFVGILNLFEAGWVICCQRWRTSDSIRVYTLSETKARIHSCHASLELKNTNSDRWVGNESWACMHVIIMLFSFLSQCIGCMTPSTLHINFTNIRILDQWIKSNNRLTSIYLSGLMISSVMKFAAFLWKKTQYAL